MKSCFYLLAVLFFVACSSKYDEKYRNTNPYHTFVSTEDLKETLKEISKIKNSTLRSSVEQQLWDSLLVNRKIPFVIDTSVVFLYRGKAQNVHFVGDFTQWKIVPECEAQPVRKTSFWILEKCFPANARVDYKIVLDKINWILDSSNQHIQFSGFGPNSELRMPEWEPSPWLTLDTIIEKGELRQPQKMVSQLLGYEVQYRVYWPASKSEKDIQAIIYVTDGHEYSDPQLGNMTTVLDNMIAKMQIKPLVCVFIDPRDPENLKENRRRQQYSGNELFVNFLADELVPDIEKELKINILPQNRAILGTSLGGWNALYTGLLKSSTFQLIAAQSPAVNEDLARMFAKQDKLPLKMIISCGTINDGAETTRLLRDVLIYKGYSIEFIEVNQGHSWGAWRNQLDAILKTFFAMPRIKSLKKDK
ncbi:MAG TPA: alpha/beta hydrolase-fold protein [Salinivirgaceae bacterium]|nr:alpha/beta hydrolase-fold protein [Salinivirgaceae bacterium]